MIEVKNLEKKFPDKYLFKDASFTINSGEFISVIGKNGTGKTTFLRILMGIDKKYSGSISFEKNDIKFGYVPQFRNIDDDYPLSVQSFIELNLQKDGFIIKNSNDKKRIKEALEKTGLTKLKNKPLGVTSGGEKQKTYLAQAIVNNPDILILDESTASLDGVAKEQLMTLVKKLNEENNMTIIFVTHDYELARKYTNQYLWFSDETIKIKKITELSENVFKE